MRILQVSAELFPLLKTGGLADIAGALPLALMAAGHEARVLLPGFPAILAGVAGAAPVAALTAPWGERARLLLGRIATAGAPDMPIYVCGDADVLPPTRTAVEWARRRAPLKVMPMRELFAELERVFR